ncbi:hypothetical protein ACOBR2_07290 [Telmatobacter bradus]|uniref:hypothetical protein n=1 Tax=Telmatobacter bradus TaxID=474953 RepID=UPI003B428B7A
MTRKLIALAALLFAATLAMAQTPTGKVAAPHPHTHITPTYEITIHFKRIYHGKPHADKSYTLLATVGEALPAIRDDARFRTDTTVDDATHTIEGATDVDILSLKSRGKSICVGLKISMKTLGIDAPVFLPKLPEQGTHQYLITPTIPLGKQITVYHSYDALANTTVEVQLMITPFDPVRGEVIH